VTAFKVRGWAAAAAAVLAGLCLGIDASVAPAQSSAPYFSALPASGSSELPLALDGAVAAPLPDGQVLIAGGNNDGTYVQNAELFNPTTETFTALPASGSTELPTARAFAVAAPLPDGQILIAGGENGSGSILQSAVLFNPANDTFTALPASGNTQLQTARVGAVAAPLPDGQVLIAGGGNGSSPALSSAELFTPANDTFTALPASGNTQLQTARVYAVAAPLPDGQILIAGGQTAVPATALQSAELFDPANDTFSALPASGSTELQSATYGAVAAPLPDGRVLIAGGQNASNGILQSAELFDPATTTFTALPASGTTELQTARGFATGTPLPTGQVLIAGGYSAGVDLQSSELYSPAPQAAVAGGNFGDQTIGQPSGVQTLVLTNIGAQALTVSAATLDAGGDSGDFAITADACAGRTLAFEQTCTITTQFTPSASGPRTATIQLSDNEPTASTITLTGNGVTANSGPSGPTGGQGPPGAPGQIKLITCHPVTKTVKRHGKPVKVKQQKCTSSVVSGTATFTTTLARATLTHNGIIYATGTADLTRLTLEQRRPIRPGHYTLTLTHHPSNHHQITTRRPITIT
jgi:hypothetical protein